jgi:hypothetical protein
MEVSKRGIGCSPEVTIEDTGCSHIQLTAIDLQRVKYPVSREFGCNS